MKFKQLDIYTKSEGIQLLIVRLTDIGITGFTIHDSGDFEEFLSNKDANWDYIDDELMKLKDTPTFITAYIADDTQGAELLFMIKGLLNELKSGKNAGLFGELRLEINSVREEDWENSWKEYYKPFEIGERFIIKPTWENVEAKSEKLILEIDPASTFGTGQHNTTQLCMEALEKLIKHGDRQLDLGTGSGILSIAGLLLGAGEVTVVDIFENAVRVASENIEQNHFTDLRYNAYCGNVIEDNELRDKIGGDYDIITANIVADVIIPMSGTFRSFLKSGGYVIVSGIISERLDEVLDALRKNGLVITEVREKEDWNAIICKLND